MFLVRLLDKNIFLQIVEDCIDDGQGVQVYSGEVSKYLHFYLFLVRYLVLKYIIFHTKNKEIRSSRRL